MHYLDTNTIIAVQNNGPAALRERHVKELGSGEQIGVPVIALLEMICGY